LLAKGGLSVNDLALQPAADLEPGQKLQVVPVQFQKLPESVRVARSRPAQELFRIYGAHGPKTKEPNSKNQISRTKSQEPNSKSQVPIGIWFLEFGSCIPRDGSLVD
jgi:hypothetical protein